MDNETLDTEPTSKRQWRRVLRRDGLKFVVVTGVISVLWIVTILYLNQNSVVSYLTTRTSEKIEFNLREYMHKTPPLSKKIKIYALDDSTVAYLKTSDLEPLQWAKLLANFAAQKPRAILTDKMFGATPADDPANREAHQILSQIKTPIYTGVYSNETELPSRPETVLKNDEYNIGNLFKNQPLPPNLTALLPPLDANKTKEGKEKKHLYGYGSWFNGLFKGVGHITYHDDGRVPPVIFYQHTKLLPHLAITPFVDDMYIKDHALYINNQPTPLDSEGLTRFNHRPPELVAKNNRSLHFAVERAMQGKPEPNIVEGDVVLILTFYTGGSDFHEGTPFGTVPGGYLVAALIDAALEHTWLTTMEIDKLMILVMCGLGILIGVFSAPVQFWALSILISALLFCTGMYLFIYHAVIFPWLLPWIGFMVSGMIHFANQSIQNELKKVSIKRDYFAEKARRLEEENKKIQLEESLALGRAIQNLLLPKQYTGHFNQYTYEMKYTPSHIMSGDWLYIWQFSPSEQRIVIGDVMGKGPSAAIGVAIIIGVLKEAEISRLSMHDALLRINERMIDLFGAAQITTTCAAIVLRDNNRIDLYNAGTPGWFLASKSKNEIYHLRCNSLGIEPTFQPAMAVIEAPPNSILFTFTDGYLEGSRATRKLMRAMEHRQVFNHHVDTLHEILMQSGEGHRLVDDRSLLAIKAA